MDHAILLLQRPCVIGVATAWLLGGYNRPECDYRENAAATNTAGAFQ